MHENKGISVREIKYCLDQKHALRRLQWGKKEKKIKYGNYFSRNIRKKNRSVFLRLDLMERLQS